MPVAGKTGTTSDYKDRWYVGCTPYYVAAIWTGYDQPERIYCTGNPAAQIFRKIMRPIHEGLEWKSFPWPYIGGDTYVFGDLTEEQEDDGETLIVDDNGTSISQDDPGGGGGGSTEPDPGTPDDEVIIIG